MKIAGAIKNRCVLMVQEAMPLNMKLLSKASKMCRDRHKLQLSSSALFSTVLAQTFHGHCAIPFPASSGDCPITGSSALPSSASLGDHSLRGSARGFFALPVHQSKCPPEGEEEETVLLVVNGWRQGTEAHGAHRTSVRALNQTRLNH